jgi:hypothetical protein
MMARYQMMRIIHGLMNYLNYLAVKMNKIMKMKMDTMMKMNMVKKHNKIRKIKINNRNRV